jgi:hypothetical protein
MNQIKEKQEGPEEELPAGDYFVVATEFDSYYVTPETARRLGRALDRFWRPRWLKFVDRHGARAWVLARSVDAIRESTELQRAGDRTFNRALRREQKADRRWDDDEY